jgi:hypothetical protein
MITSYRRTGILMLCLGQQFSNSANPLVRVYADNDLPKYSMATNHKFRLEAADSELPRPDAVSRIPTIPSFL